MKDEEFMGNVRVTITDREVRVWVCNKEGQNIFRFKALGKVYHVDGQGDYTVIGK